MRTLKRTFIAMFAFALCLGLAFIMPTKQAKADDGFTYVAGTEYDATTDYIVGQNDINEYNGVAITPFTYQGEWWDANVLGANAIGTGTFNAAGLAIGSVSVLQFANPVSAKDFETITLAFGSNGGAILEVYNVNEISNGALGALKTNVTIPHWAGVKINLDIADYADENGEMSAIAFKLTSITNGAEECEIAFSGFTLKGAFAYEENVVYDATADYIVGQSGETEYNGVAITPFVSQGDWWDTNVLGANAVGTETFNAANLTVGSSVVLRFKHEIDVAVFENIYLTFGSNGGAKLETYNVNEISEGTFGEVKSEIEIPHWQGKTVKVALSDYANRNGIVTAIAFRLTSITNGATTCELAFSGFSLGKPFVYENGKVYDVCDGGEDYIILNSAETEYNGLTVVPFSEKNTAAAIAPWFGDSATDNVYLTANGALTTGSAFVIEFGYPINVAEFNTLHLEIALLKAGDPAVISAYNVNEIAGGVLGEIKETTSVRADVTDLRLDLRKYADENGIVSAIAFTTDKDVIHCVLDGFYLKNEATVTFKDGETLVKTETVERGSLIAAPETPEKTKEGYTVTFEGWFNDETKWNFETDKLENDVTLTAKFTEVINEYSCTFTDVEENAEKITYTVDDRAEKLAALKEKLHEDTAQYAYYNNLPEVLPLENGGAYSETRTIKKYKVTIGNGEPTEYEYGAEIVKPADPVIEEKVGYESTFVGWAYGDGENDIWNFDGDNKNTVTGNVTLTARINEKIIKYTVTFVADGKEIAKLNYTVENKEIEEPAVPEKEGYTGAWEEYELTFGDVTVNAVYAEIPAPSESESSSESESEIPSESGKPSESEKPSGEQSDNDGSGAAGGCFGAVGSAVIPLAFCLALAGVVIFKKKKD